MELTYTPAPKALEEFLDHERQDAIMLCDRMFRYLTTNRQYIHDVRENQTQFEQFLKRRKDLSDSERQCFEHESIRETTGYWLKAAGSTVSAYDKERQHGWRHWARTVESAAEAANRFMRAFEPLLSVVTNSGPEVGAAVGLISGFFAVAASRSKTNDLIASQMAKILDRLPGFEMLEAIYVEDDKEQARLRRKIFISYYSVVDFAITATRYYLRSGLSRWWVAFASPSRFIDATEKVQTQFAEVQHKSDELLVQTVHHVRRINLELQQDIADRNILMVKDLLGLSRWSSSDREKKLAAYEKELSREEMLSAPLDWMSRDKVANFRQQKVFSDWEQRPKSEMLLLLAGTDSRLQSSMHCWMSPIALAIIHELRGNLKSAQATGPLRGYELVFCVLDLEPRTSVHDIASEVLLGLLRAQKSFKLPELSAKLEAYRSIRQTGSRREKKKALRAAVSAVAGLLSPQLRICLVIDRIDRCEEQMVLLEILTDLMKVTNLTGCCIKILAVANAAFWDLNQDEERSLVDHPQVRFFGATRSLSAA
ncbi:hypothetical protein Q7P37_006162 [Cladosporium fusiforme]